MKAYIRSIGIHSVRSKRVLFLVIGVCVFLLTQCGPLMATHIIGGDITYRCLGNHKYELRLRMRRDCFLGDPGTEFDNPAAIGVFKADTYDRIIDLRTPLRTDDTLNQHLISDCTIAGMDVCVEETIYVDTVSLPFYQPGYIVAYQRCCRNISLGNVVDPVNTGMTIMTVLNAEVQMSQDNSPVFGEFPPIYVCVNKPIAFDFSATDLEGDSLSYELFTPFQGATDSLPMPRPTPKPPYDTVIWKAPYSLANLLGGADPVRIDPVTGVITGTPVLIGQFLVGVKINSYRNGQFIAAVTREWQYNVRACRDVPVADYDASLLNCSSLSVDFSQQTQNADQFLWIFDYGNPQSETSPLLNPSFTFPGEGFYNVALIVNDQDSICFDTIVKSVGVFESQVYADFSLNIPDCNTEIILAPTDLSDDPNPDYSINQWEWVLSYGNVHDSSDVQHPSFTITENVDSVLLSLTVTSANGCTADYSEYFDVNIINIPFAGDTLQVCTGGSITLVQGDPDFSYTWSPSETLDLTDPSSPVATPTGNTLYSVTVTDGICVVTDQVYVAVQPLPDGHLPAVDTSCFGAPTPLNPGGDPGYQYQWSPASGLNMTDVPNPIADVDASMVFYVTITDPSGLGCSTKDSVFLFVPPDIHLGAPSDTAYCDTPAITLTASGSGLEYTWYTSDGVPIGTGMEIVVQPTEPTTYILEGLDIYGCSVQQTVTLTPTVFDYSLSDVPVLCVGDQAVLSVTDNAGQNLTYVWTVNDSIAGTSSSLSITPSTSTEYAVQITNADLGCVANDTIDVTVGSFDPNFLQIFINKDTVVLGDTFILSTNQPHDLTYLWDGPGIGDPTLPVVTGIPSSAGTYTYAVTVTNEFGCTLTAVISNLTVINPQCNMDDIFIPDAFSPNGDGHNDVLYVYGNYISSMELRIFNRWGQQVFVSTNQSDGWDGTYKGKSLPPDVFGYYLRVTCPPDKSYFMKGNITLLK